MHRAPEKMVHDAAPHQDDTFSRYDEANERILRIIRAEQRRLGV